jgi:hypothetical protein
MSEQASACDSAGVESQKKNTRYFCCNATEKEGFVCGELPYTAEFK